MNAPPARDGICGLRTPDTVMHLERMGASFPTRMSFMRQLVRRMYQEGWRLERARFDLDAKGFGVSIYAAHGPRRTYSLIGFSRDIDPDQRTDRVIAETWDATFSLFDGVPGASDIERLRVNTPRQESGRFRPSELVLARGNRSVRLFDHVVDSLAQGRQPDANLLDEVGYLMRTTAVYGSGKFGCADREKIADRPELKAPFQAELLAVYLIRWMTIDLVNHIALSRSGARAVELDPVLARHLGIGNATGLGMAPFLVSHPLLINNWAEARETALARVRALPDATPSEIAGFRDLLERARRHVDEWNVDDAAQTDRIERLRVDLARLHDWCDDGLLEHSPWDRAWRLAEREFSLEGQELLVSLLLEQQGALVDELCEAMSSGPMPGLGPGMSLAEVLDIINSSYDWALAIDYSRKEALQRFWYYSQEKLEPRVGDRYAEPGSDVEMPVAVGRDVTLLKARLLEHGPGETVADFLVAAPEFRGTVRRIQTLAQYPYGEIRDNLLARHQRPVDILRFKLAFFGASKFDPKSDLWTRVTMYQGAPLPHEIAAGSEPQWIFPTRPLQVR